MGGLMTKREEAFERPFRSILSRYEGPREWLSDAKFLKDLEADSVDTEVLDEELQVLESTHSKSWRFRLHKFLERNPVQIAMCILVLIDAGVVIAEIMLDLNAIRMENEETRDQLLRAADFLKEQYASQLNGYTGDDVDEIIQKLKPNATYSRHKRHVIAAPPAYAPPPAGAQPSAYAPPPAGAPSRGYTPPTAGAPPTVYAPPTAGAPPPADAPPVDGSAPRFGGLPRSGAAPPSDFIAMLRRMYHEQYNNWQERASGVQRSYPSHRVGSRGQRLKRSPDDLHKTEAFHGITDGALANTMTAEDTTNSNKNGHDTDDHSGQSADHSEGHSGGHSAKSKLAHELHELAHILHYISICILGIFVVQLILKVTAMGTEFFHQKMEIFDAFIVIASFVLDIVFLNGVTNAKGDETLALIIIFLLWRILRIINGIMLTSKKRQEFRIKLQKRARRKLEKRMECLLEDKEWRDREMSNLKGLCLNKGATDDEIRLCTPRRRSVFHKLTTSTGLSSIASLSLGLSLSGPLVMKNQLPNFPILPRSCRTSLAGTTGTKSTRSSSTSLEPVWMGRSGVDPSSVDSEGDTAEPRSAYQRAPYLRSRSNTCDEEAEEEEEEHAERDARPTTDSTEEERNGQYSASTNHQVSTGLTSAQDKANGLASAQSSRDKAAGQDGNDSELDSGRKTGEAANDAKSGSVPKFTSSIVVCGKRAGNNL